MFWGHNITDVMVRNTRKAFTNLTLNYSLLFLLFVAPEKSILDFRYDNNVIGEMLFEIMTNTSFPGLTVSARAIVPLEP